MKKTITIFKKAILVTLLLFMAQWSYGANFYAYKSNAVTVNAGTGFAEYKWILVVSPGATNTVIENETSASLTQTFTTEGQYKLRVIVRNADGCWSDVDANTDIDIYVLPDFTVTVAPDGDIPATYCTNVAAEGKTTLKATMAVTGSEVLPDEITFAAADWYKTPQSGDIAALTAVTTNSNTYSVVETVVDTYYFVATSKYVIPASRLISAANGVVKSTPPTSVIVKPAPTTPSIIPVITNNP